VLFGCQMLAHSNSKTYFVVNNFFFFFKILETFSTNLKTLMQTLIYPGMIINLFPWEF
jgi:hypothetical protein